MKKSLKIMMLAGIASLLALTGCTTVAGQTDPAAPVQAPPLQERLADFPEFLSVQGTVAEIEEIDGNVSLVRIYWTEIIEGAGGDVAELPMQIYLYIDQDTALLVDSELEAGMFVTAVYRAPTPEQQLTPNEILSAVAISDRSIKAARFDENWMYHNILLTITDDTEIILQNGRPFEGETAELQGRALVVIVGMSGTPQPGDENQIHVNWPSKIVVLFEQAAAPVHHLAEEEIAAMPSTSDNINVTVNGRAVSFTGQTPIISENRTLVPIRDVFETMGFIVEWEEATSTVTLSDRRTDIVIEIGAPRFTVIRNANTDIQTEDIIYVDVPAQIIDGRTMLPLRAILENVGYELGWDGATNTVIVTGVPTPTQ